VAGADVILTGEALNSSLKNMQRLQRQMQEGTPDQRAATTFELGVEADALATLLTDEVAAHGMQERQLLELALKRTRDAGVLIRWMIAKDRFFYDGDAFRRYLAAAPNGPKAAESAFWLVETEFYQTSGGDPTEILPSIERKKAFLARHPTFQLAPDVGVFVAIDYRDLFRHYRDKGDARRAARFEKLARAQFARVAARHPDTEQGRIAAEMRRRLEAEVSSPLPGEGTRKQPRGKARRPTSSVLAAPWGAV
jgi:hypothetical protein